MNLVKELMPSAEVVADRFHVMKQINQELDEQKRLITGVIGDIRIINLYVPNGSSLDSDKYIYKLKWLEGKH